MTVFAPVPSYSVVAIGGAGWTRDVRRVNGLFRSWLESASHSIHVQLWTEDHAPFCPALAKRWMRQEGLWRSRPLSLIGYSAGCVAVRAIAAELGPEFVKAIVAVDGWCVPFHGIESPVYRLSHDRATHENGLAWGGGSAQFYAEPGVGHLYLWGNLDCVTGWRCGDREPGKAIAAEFVKEVLREAIA